MSLNEPEVRNCDLVTVVDHGPNYSTEVWIGDELVFLAKRLTYYPPVTEAWDERIYRL